MNCTLFTNNIRKYGFTILQTEFALLGQVHAYAALRDTFCIGIAAYLFEWTTTPPETYPVSFSVRQVAGTGADLQWESPAQM